MSTVELVGAPGSPYTRKMLALMRFRNIPYRIQWQSIGQIFSPDGKQRPVPKVPLLPLFFLPNDAGDEEAVTDSSPILRRFEKEFSGRSVIPTDPVLAFLNWLFEDYGDEWLTKSMFHYRWHYERDAHHAGSVLPRWSMVTSSDAEVEPLSHVISSRQIERLRYVGSNALTKDTIEGSFFRFLTLLNAHLQTTPYLFGHRPSSADFAFYGQLTQLALFDPTPREIVAGQFPRIYAWVEILEDLSGLVVDEVAGWIDVSGGLPQTLLDLIRELAELYLPYLQINSAAVMRKAELVDGVLDGRPYQQNAFPYQHKCLTWILEQYEGLAPDDQKRLAAVTDQAGLVAALSACQQTLQEDR